MKPLNPAIHKTIRNALLITVTFTLQACSILIPEDDYTKLNRYNGYWRAEVKSAEPRQKRNGLTLVCPTDSFNTYFDVDRGIIKMRSRKDAIKSHLRTTGEFEVRHTPYPQLVEVEENGIYLTNTAITPIYTGDLSRWGFGFGTFTLGVGSLANQGCTTKVSYHRVRR